MPQILRNAVATGDSDILTVRSADRGYPRLVRVVLPGVASVQLYGRFDSHDTWFTLGTAFTATGTQAISLPPQVKLVVTAWTSGPVNGWVDAYATSQSLPTT
jgi:hypothetical protein